MNVETAVVYATAGAKSAADQMQEQCLQMNRDGWRLVATLPDTATGGDMIGGYLFFEREAGPRDAVEENVAAMDADERRELMDVAVAQAVAESPAEDSTR